MGHNSVISGHPKSTGIILFNFPYNQQTYIIMNLQEYICAKNNHNNELNINEESGNVFKRSYLYFTVFPSLFLNPVLNAS